MDQWVDHWNDDLRPFAWTKTANEIIDKVRQGRIALERQNDFATHH